MSNKKIVIIGHQEVGSGTITEAVLAIGKSRMTPVCGGIEKIAQQINKNNAATESKPPTFKTKSEQEKFLNDTKHITQKKAPKMPFKMLGYYLKEYTLIGNKKSKLSGAQRIRVKNVVHHHLRKGTIILK